MRRPPAGLLTVLVGVSTMVLALGACGYPDASATGGDAATTLPTQPSPTAGALPPDSFTQGSNLAPVRFPDGLAYVDLRAGTGATVLKNSAISAHYTGWLADGTKFDSSRQSGQAFDVSLGAGQVIPCWDEGLPGMRVGGRRRLTCPPSLAYGAQGSPPAIPANATLVFTVEVMAVQPPVSPSP